MEFGSFPENQWSAFRDIEGAAHTIKKRCDKLVTLLIDTASVSSILGNGAVEITATDGDRIANVKTPVGNGRFVLSWEISGNELLGLMLFERERYDEYGRQFWEPVWGVKVPKYESPYSGAEAAAVAIPLDQAYGYSRSNAVFAALMSMLYGLVNGPVKI